MSLSRETTVWCDEPECFAWYQASGNGADVRRDAKEHGWVHRAGADLCPEHATPTVPDRPQAGPLP